MKHYKEIKHDKVHKSTNYLFEYRSKYVEKNLTWTQDLILKSLKTDIKHAVEDKLIDIDPMEQGVHLVSQLVLNTILYVSDKLLRYLVSLIKKFFVNVYDGEVPLNNFNQGLIVSEYGMILGMAVSSICKIMNKEDIDEDSRRRTRCNPL